MCLYTYHITSGNVHGVYSFVKLWDLGFGGFKFSEESIQLQNCIGAIEESINDDEVECFLKNEMIFLFSGLVLTIHTSI